MPVQFNTLYCQHDSLSKLYDTETYNSHEISLMLSSGILTIVNKDHGNVD